nr:hypothetical protein [Amylibacter sp.]
MSKGDRKKGNKEMKKPKKEKTKEPLVSPLGALGKSQPMIGGKKIK